MRPRLSFFTPASPAWEINHSSLPPPVLPEPPVGVSQPTITQAIANVDLADIAKHTQLRELYLAKTGVGDEGLAHLRSLTQLRIISLADTQITDAGLKHLAAVKSLRHIFLYPTKVTDAGVAELKSALPGVQVRY